MNKRIIVTSLATVTAAAAIGAGGLVWTSTGSADVPGADRDRIGAAAVQAAGGGTATDIETSDDRGEAYEVEVRTADGKEWDVELDAAFTVLRTTEDS